MRYRSSNCSEYHPQKGLCGVDTTSSFIPPPSVACSTRSGKAFDAVGMVLLGMLGLAAGAGAPLFFFLLHEVAAHGRHEQLMPRTPTT